MENITKSLLMTRTSDYFMIITIKDKPIKRLGRAVHPHPPKKIKNKKMGYYCKYFDRKG